jgi:metal-sulfur cluster biosynthetic enzyme
MPSIADVSVALQQVEDPELGMDLVELGLIYDIAVDGPAVKVVYSLTSIGCPVGQWLEDEIVRVVSELDGVDGVAAELTFDPPWTPERMSDDAKFILGIL